MKKFVQASGLILVAVGIAVLASFISNKPSGLFSQTFVGFTQRAHVVRVVVDHSRLQKIGSGTLVRSDLVLTCHHVIRDARPGDRVFVEFSGGLRRECEIIKIDKKQDLALLKIDPVIIASVRPADNPVTKGQEVVICGFPDGKEYEEISGKVVGFGSPTLRSKDTLFVVDNRAKSAMSGGPVLNMEGEIVGVLFGSLRFANCTGLDAIKNFLKEVR